MQGGLGDIMHQQQIRQLISKLTKYDISQYASSAWYKQDEKLQRLNMQLHINAVMKNDEFILEQCIVNDKYQGIIIDLLITSVWKKNMIPVVKREISNFNSMKVYLAIYHEAVICNMLEVMLYHYTAVKESKGLLTQIIDYCHKKIVSQLSKSVKKRLKQRQAKKEKKQQQKESIEEKKQKKLKQTLKINLQQQFTNQVEQIQFSIFIMCVSIIKYISDYTKQLQIGIIHQLIVQCNILFLLSSLIEQKPWLKTNQNNQREIFQNNKWNIIPKNQYGRLPKTQGQVWLTLYNLFADPQCMKKYQLNNQRKDSLLRLRKYMNQVLLDQIPALSAMLRSLQQLSMMNIQQRSYTPLIISQIPMVLEQIQKNIRWQELINVYKQRLRSNRDEEEKQHMMRLAELYSNNNVEGLMEGFKCGKCLKQAFKRCSKCKDIWYCSRECQVGDWPTHKKKCNERAKELQQIQEKINNKQVISNKPNLINQLD